MWIVSWGSSVFNVYLFHFFFRFFSNESEQWNFSNDDNKEQLRYDWILKKNDWILGKRTRRPRKKKWNFQSNSIYSNDSWMNRKHSWLSNDRLFFVLFFNIRQLIITSWIFIALCNFFFDILSRQSNWWQSNMLEYLNNAF